MGEKKEYSRSIRMTNRVREYVENQDGKGFNEKFENLVMHCMDNIVSIEKEINKKEKELKELNSKVSKSAKILDGIDNMKWNIEQLIRKAETLNKEQE